MRDLLNGVVRPQRQNHARARKEAAKHLGIALTADYRRLIGATGEEEVSRAAMTLGENFNQNIEFICWCLKEYGGVQQMPFQPPNRPALPKLPQALTGQD